MSITADDIIQTQRKFEQAIESLRIAPYDMWVASFKQMIELCEKTLIITTIIKPLRDNRSISAEQWFSDWESPDHGGRQRFIPIASDYDGFVLVYKILKKFYDNEISRVEISIREFCYHTFQGGSGRGEKYQQFFNTLIDPYANSINAELGKLVHSTSNANVSWWTNRRMSLASIIIAAIAVVFVALSYFYPR